MTSTQAGEMTSDEAGFFIAQLLARQAREAVTTNGWARSSNDRAAYLYGELGPRSTAMHTHHQRVSAFRLSGPHLMTAWGPLLVPELVAEAIAQIVKFATNDQAATHFSLIKRWRARYPDVMEQLVPNYPMSPPWPIIPPLATAFLFKSFGLEEEAQEEVIVALTRWLITGFVVLSDGQIHTTPSHPPTRDRTLRLPLKGAPLKTITELFPAFGRDEDQVRAQVWHRVLGHFNVGTDQIDIAITSAVNAYCAGNWGQRTPEHLESILQRVELISGVPCVLNVTHVANAATLDFLEALRLGKPENQPHLAQIAKFANLAGLLTADRERLANRLWNGSEAQKCGRYLHDEVALLRTLFGGDALATRVAILVEPELTKGVVTPLLSDLCVEFGLTNLKAQADALLAASNQPGFDEDDPVAVWQTTVRQAAAQTEISHGAGNFLLPLFPERPL